MEDARPHKKGRNEFPMRINKYLAYTNHSTRRGGDELVEKRHVYINGRVALLGDMVDETDVVEVRRSGKPKEYVYFAYHKPRGVITHSPQMGEQDIESAISHIPEAAGVFPIGRLDKDSSGLMILTNDGRITDRLLNPEYAHEKEYVVETTDKLREDFAEAMESGVTIDEYVTQPCKVAVTGPRTFRITLGEGKKHQIRRMVDAMGTKVSTLTRVRVMNIELGDLKPGKLRKIEGEKLSVFLKSLGM